ncbi:Spore coat protein U [Lysobacter dokdonensis DS-58]|uniref:Spore coat protein U n=1 Tax=Lysobacter dokdonensis DS-58 TaxID=1300345 RepID=A0A0A2WKS8_9GAMM|nr:Spore coat protein U [Lysobacter dokdonensis DS-58]
MTGVLFASSAQAATAPAASLPVTANVAATCVVTSTTAVAFGAYDPLAATPLNGAGTISVRCTKGTSADIALGVGANASTASCTTLTRRMTNGTDFLGYGLYSDTGRSTVWGCDTTNDITRSSTSSITPAILNVYGQIPNGQDVGVGSYTDSVAIVVTF